MHGLAVAAPNRLAADAATAMAETGGTAIDAAVAAALVAVVTEPGVAALLGSAYCTLALPGRDPVTVDGDVEMPGRAAPPEVFGTGVHEVTTAYGGGLRTGVGHGTVATPGAPAALAEAHRLGGRLPWAEVVAPAEHAAREGFPLGSASAQYLALVHDVVFGWDPATSHVVHRPDGTPITLGDTVHVPDLADALALIAAEGAGTLYRGALAEVLVADMAAHGGLLGPADLAAYTPLVRPALPVRMGQWSLATNPAPSVGGPVLAAMLMLLEGRPTGEWTPQDREVVVEVQRAALGHRSRHLDAATDRVAAAEALLAAVRAEGPAWLRTAPSTVHVSCADDAGAACAITSSAGYGSGVVVPGTGLWLNNCLAEPELNRRGLHAWPPGTRLPSNMAPTVGRDDHGAVLAIGSPGADRITTALAQVLAGITAGMPLDAAIDAPRVHVGQDPEGRATLDRESDAEVPADLCERLDLVERDMGHHHMYFGGVAAAVRGADGGMRAAADPRRTGATGVLLSG